MCLEGLQERYAGDPRRWRAANFRAEVMARLDRELDVIDKLGFPNYFLIVWDFVRFARSQGIQATARGSGVGSLVCYALHLSHVCPLEYDLLFERFLDESRREAPDIDIDFCQQRRGEVIQYVKEKYGVENVAQIGTFGTLAARAAIRDVGRALGLPIPRVDAVVALVPEELKITLADALEKSDDLKKLYETDLEIRELLDLAMRIEGLARNVGTHAAAVVIADRPLTDYVPLQHVQNKEEVITQWAMADVERAGLLKMDFLGLRNLTILSKVVELIEQTTGREVDPYSFPLDDQETFALLCRGETKGVFQLESGGIRDLLQRMKPDHFRDIIATNALYRPGPLEGGMVDDYIQVKHGRKEAEYKHPVMKEILEETHGVMVYQEQVMRILNRLGGIALANAYSCIKAISKKKLEAIAKYREEFVDGAHQQGLAKKEAADLFGLIEKFAGYGFNKCHSHRLRPDRLHDGLPEGPLSGRIHGRLADQRHSGPQLQEEGLAGRAPGGLPADEHRGAAARREPLGRRVHRGRGQDLLRPVGHQGLRRRRGGGHRPRAAAGRALSQPLRLLRATRSRHGQPHGRRIAGKGRRLGLPGRPPGAILRRDRPRHAGRRRRRLRPPQRPDGPLRRRRRRAAAAAVADLPDVPEWEPRDRLAKEKEVLGFYLTSHPLAEHEKTLAAYCSHTTAEAAALKHRTEVMLGGMISAIKLAHTKNPKPGSPSRYAMFDLEDTAGIIRCILWPEQFVQYGELVEADAIRVVRGAIDKRPGSDEANLIVNEIIALEDLGRAHPQRARSACWKRSTGW